MFEIWCGDGCIVRVFLCEIKPLHKFDNLWGWILLICNCLWSVVKNYEHFFLYYKEQIRWNYLGNSLSVIYRSKIMTFSIDILSYDQQRLFLLQDDGGIEYFNTIVVQPHLKLVTNQGRGFHIRCRYSTRNNTAVLNESQSAK